MPDLPGRLATPSLAMLPRAVNQLSFVHIDRARVEKDDNGVAAVIETPEHGTERIYLPTASIAAVLLGPGVSVTQPAAVQICRDGASIVLTGAGGVRCYGSITHNDLTTKWLQRQASAWADTQQRESTARWLYGRRFSTSDIAKNMTIAQLRGMEGQRVKRAYAQHAAKHGAKFRRTLDIKDYNSLDPVNKALNAGNQVLYGVVHATMLALGVSPALGFIHTGSQRSFVYDIADLYKLDLSVPLAFKYRDHPNPDPAIRRHFRDSMKALRLAKHVVNDIQGALTCGEEWDEGLAEDELDSIAVTSLWDPELGAIPAKQNYDPLDATGIA